MRKRATIGPAHAEAQTLSDQLGWLEQIAKQGGEISFGAPTRCPHCGNFGFVDSVAGGVQRNHCLGCGCHWAFSQKALALFDESVPAKTRTSRRVIGSGILVEDLDLDA